ncbi:hypothetical protein [Sinomicrobium sp. M5D2P9]
MNKIKFAYDRPGESHKYAFTYKSIVRINGHIISDITYENEFNLILQGKGTDYVFEVDTLSSKRNAGFDYFKDFSSLLEDMMAIKNHLVLKTTLEGELKEVLNTDELKSKWEELKRNLSSYKGYDKMSQEQIAELINSGDLEYSDKYDIAKDLKNGSFWTLMFNGIHNKDFFIEKRTPLENFEQYSGVFEKSKIPVQSYGEIDMDTDDENIVRLVLNGNLDISRFDEQKIKELFEKNYEFTQEPYKRYQYDYFASYEIDNRNGWIKSVKNSTYEAVNAAVEAEIESTIEQIV